MPGARAWLSGIDEEGLLAKAEGLMVFSSLDPVILQPRARINLIFNAVVAQAATIVLRLGISMAIGGKVITMGKLNPKIHSSNPSSQWEVSAQTPTLLPQAFNPAIV